MERCGFATLRTKKVVDEEEGEGRGCAGVGVEAKGARQIFVDGGGNGEVGCLERCAGHKCPVLAKLCSPRCALKH